MSLCSRYARMQLPGRMPARPELEHHRSHRQLLDRCPYRTAFGRQFLQRRADEDSEALIRSPNEAGNPAHVHSLLRRLVGQQAQSSPRALPCLLA